MPPRDALADSEHIAAGLRDDLERARADRDAALAHAEELTRALRIADLTHDATLAERDALRAIIEGRTAAPTEAEVDALAESGGAFRYRGDDGKSGMVHTRYDLPFAVATFDRESVTWWALDEKRRPCPWPVVTEAPDAPR